MYSLEQKKRGLCHYDDKRYLLADLPDGSANPTTHAYGHKDLAAEEQFEADMPDAPGSDLLLNTASAGFSRSTTASSKNCGHFQVAMVTRTQSRRMTTTQATWL